MTEYAARNLLADETSPYLQMHKDDPVHWRPWGQAALDEAKATGKPIFLSSGFTACHWCHVMQAESFADPEIAAMMNANFVNVKIDREERPDIDQIYQTAGQIVSRATGWPLTAFLDSNGIAFSAGTYHAVEDNNGRMGWRSRLNNVLDVWANRRDEITKATDTVRDALNRAWNDNKIANVNPNIIDVVARRLTQRIDLFFGGTEGEPKFPHTPVLNLIWRAFMRTGMPQFSSAVLTTLDHMCQGGIYDHLGGGFHRYASDERWILPHFEKMLADNALIIEILTLVWPMTRSPLYAARVDETIDWVLREMVTDTGAFASALSSDSDGREGKFYVWSEGEVDEVLGPNDAPLFKQIYAITPTDKSIDDLVMNRLAAIGHLRPEQEALLTRARRMLMMARSKRVRPRRDDKVLPDANGLMIAAMADAGAVFKKPEWHFAAIRAFWAVVEKNGEGDKLYQASIGDQRDNLESTAEGYAQMARAAAKLFEYSSDSRYLVKAGEWMGRLNSHFYDSGRGGYCMTSSEAEAIPFRIRTGLNIGGPSYTGVIVETLARLSALTGDQSYRDRAGNTIEAFGAEVNRQPTDTSTLLNALEFTAQPVHVVIMGDERAPETQSLLRAVLDRSLPCRILTILKPGQKLPKDHPAFGKGLKDGKPTVYVCVGKNSSDPITDPAALSQGLLPVPILQQMAISQARAQQQAQAAAAQPRAGNR